MSARASGCRDAQSWDKESFQVREATGNQPTESQPSVQQSQKRGSWPGPGQAGGQMYITVLGQINLVVSKFALSWEPPQLARGTGALLALANNCAQPRPRHKQQQASEFSRQ